MSAPRVVALAAHHGLNSEAGQQKLYMHIDDKDSVSKAEPQSTAKALNSENYKSLQVNRSNTTTGYMAAGKTQVQLSQHLQYPPTSHLTSNAMNILANPGPPTMPNEKSSQPDTESSRLKRDHSDNIVGATRVKMGDKSNNLSKLVSNFKVHGKKAHDGEEKGGRAGKPFQQKRHSLHQGYGEVQPMKEASKDYPTSNPSRNQNRKVVASTTQQLVDLQA